MGKIRGKILLLILKDRDIKNGDSDFHKPLPPS